MVACCAATTRSYGLYPHGLYSHGLCRHYPYQYDNRLLCCDNEKFRTVAQSSCGSGYFIQILVIHNDDTYGGAGGSIATASSNPAAPKVAITNGHQPPDKCLSISSKYLKVRRRPRTNASERLRMSINTCQHLLPSVNTYEHLWPSVNTYEHL